MKFVKKLAALTMAAIMTVSMSLSTVSATETFETPSGDVYTTNLTDYDVFEAIKVRRDVINGTEKYLSSDYQLIRLFLTNDHMLNIRYFTVSYDYEDFDTTNFKDLEDLAATTYIYKASVGIQPAALLREGYAQIGWEFDGQVYTSDDRLRMPAKDVVFTPVWKKRSTVTYTAGNYDDVVGNTSASVVSLEGINFFLTDAGRFSRPGYVITGWLCKHDNIEYKPGGTYLIPSEDVEFEAVWSPASYPITITANNGVSSDKYTTSGVYGEEFVLPECEFTKEGYTFAGWKYSGTVYQPGESFTVPALLSGEKLIVSATWK